MSDWYALELIEKSFEDMKNLLLPFDMIKMLKMALVIFFAGGGMGAASNMSSTASNMAGQTGSQSAGSITNSFMTGMASAGGALPSLIGFITLSVLLFIVVGAIMKFVFINICSTGHVSVWERFKENSGNGLRLLGFQILLLLAGLILLALPAGLMLAAGASNFVALMTSVIVLIPVLLVYYPISILTEDFAIVQMSETGEGIFSAWESIWDDVVSGWKQVGLYLLVKIALLIGSGIVVGIASIVFLLASAIIFGLLGFVGYGLFTLSEIVGGAFILLLIVTGIVFLVIGMLFIRVPVDTFFRYYSIRIFESVSDKSIIE